MQPRVLTSAVQKAIALEQREVVLVHALRGCLVAVMHPALGFQHPQWSRLTVQHQVTLGDIHLQVTDTLEQAARGGQVNGQALQQTLLPLLRQPGVRVGHQRQVHARLDIFLELEAGQVAQSVVALELLVIGAAVQGFNVAMLKVVVP
ncbi:hypothetical protein D9M68_587520 [compost metagenome]